MSFNQLTAIVGENNAGKSAFLKALDVFFGSSSSLIADDYFAGDHSEPVLITVEFCDLTPSDFAEFSDHVIEGRVTISREFIFGEAKKDAGKFYVESSVYNEFDPVRSAQNENDRKKLYHELADKLGGDILTKVTKGADIEPKLIAWEKENVDKLVSRRKGRAFGFSNVALGKLNSAAAYHLIPAVEDASAQLDSEKSSPVRDLIADIVRQTIENQVEFQNFKLQATERLKELTDPNNIPELAEVSSQLTSIVSKYYDESKINAEINPISDIPILFPKPRILVEDHNFVSIIERLGNGLQRAVLLSVLEFMATRNAAIPDADEDFLEAQSDIIIAIEEPEIFQHPVKQRLFAQALSRLASGFNKSTGIRFQVVFVTHSHLFVDIKEAQDVRVVRRQMVDGLALPEVSTVSIEECAETTAKIQGYVTNVDKYRLGLHIFNPHVSEGLFSKAVVLVEGVSDKVVLDAYFIQANFDPLLKNITIAAVGGKTNMDKPLSILSALGIPVYCVVDSDKHEKRGIKNNIKINRLIQLLTGIEEDNCIDYPSGLSERSHFFDGHLEKYIQGCAGDEHFNKIIDQLAEDFGTPPGDCMKSPHFMSSLFVRLMDEGVAFTELDEILTAVRTAVEAPKAPVLPPEAA
jgi:predicted ATP-dependent endonuclease of OLD family